MDQKIIFTNHVEDAIDTLVDSINPSSIFILVDHNVAENVLPRLQSICKSVAQAKVINVKPGDENKSLESLSYVWRFMSQNGGTRHSILINLGGGVITDMGAFAAATFKRGIKFINVPTTLLAAVDASVGGKTGINFNGLKNEIGVFKEAEAVIISTTFFNSLPAEEIKSGYAEMLKHALISDRKMLAELMKQPIKDIDPERMLSLLEENVGVKQDIVQADPTEKNVRKSLNLGHTVGHAFESLALERKSPIPHGYAVAYGMAVELVLSTIKEQFPTTLMRQVTSFIYENYRGFSFTCNDYDHIIDLMRHDKKNVTADSINLTLLKNVGEIILDCETPEKEIKAAFDIYREELMR